MSSSIRDALLSSDAGKGIVEDTFKAKQAEREKAEKLFQRRVEYRLKKISPVIDGVIESVEATIANRLATAERVRTLKDAAHNALVTERSEAGRGVRFDVYNASKPLIRSIAIEGGEKYSRMLSLLKYASCSRNAFNELLNALAPAAPAMATERTNAVQISVPV